MTHMHLPIQKGYTVMIDEADYGLVAPYTWRLSSNGYVVTSRFDPATRKTRNIYLHRLIMGAAPGQIVDHINHNKLDSTRANLRFVDHAQSQRNRRAFKTSRSGVKGVSLTK